MDRLLEGLSQDYLQNASNFIWSAKQINNIAPQSTVEGMFVAEKPIYFLLGHASELVLKSVLAKNGISIDDLRSKDYGHDLAKLLKKYREYQLPLDEDFVLGVSTIAENFKNHEHRYARSFSGFSEEDHQRWLDGKLTKKELKDYGLTVRRGININQFVKGIETQLQIVSQYLREKKAA